MVKLAYCGQPLGQGGIGHIQISGVLRNLRFQLGQTLAQIVHLRIALSDDRLRTHEVDLQCVLLFGQIGQRFFHLAHPCVAMGNDGFGALQISINLPIGQRDGRSQTDSHPTQRSQFSPQPLQLQVQLG